MKLLIITPAAPGSTKGNRITAERWALLLRQSGHQVHVQEQLAEGDWDCLIALHATRSFGVIDEFRQRQPGKPVILCLTGTDLHLDLKGQRGELALSRATSAIQHCDRLVLLEPEAMKNLPIGLREKSALVLQSATPVVPRPQPLQSCFEMCVVGHLRAEKDPFLAARAAENLDNQSEIQVTHLGDALTPELRYQALEQTKTNSRYHWLGPLPHDETQTILARSRVMILSSVVEGAPSVISEAIVNHVPILATRIQATVGLLGTNYPGLFPVHDVRALTQLMSNAESNPEFLAQLTSAIQDCSPRFHPDSEHEKLNQLLTFSTE